MMQMEQKNMQVVEWINMNKTFLVNTTNNLENPMGNLTNQQFAQWSAGYNKGDQLIGDNIAFFQWVIDAEQIQENVEWKKTRED